MDTPAVAMVQFVYFIITFKDIKNNIQPQIVWGLKIVFIKRLASDRLF